MAGRGLGFVACSALPSLVPKTTPLAYRERGSGDFGPLSWAFEVQVLRNTLINVVLECNDIAVTISVQTLFSTEQVSSGMDCNHAAVARSNL